MRIPAWQRPLAQSAQLPFDCKILSTEGGVVHLRVFDALGRVVAELENGMKPAGGYSVPFDAGALPGGVYFYRLEVNDESKSATMRLVK